MQQDLSQMVRILPEAAFLANPDGTLLAVNDALVQLSGLPAERLVGNSFKALVTEPPEKVQDYLRHCARSCQRLPGAFHWRKGDDEFLEVRCDGALVAPRSATGPALLFLQCRPKAAAVDRFTLLNRKIDALSREIFERKRVEQQRDELLRRERQARLEAERVSRMKDEFLATLSHELRTPIHAILGWTHVLLRTDAPAASREAALHTIERNARAQALIIEDLLDMSRIISGKVQLQVQPVSLATVIEAAVESMRPAAQAKSLRLDIVIDEAPGLVQGDPNRLQQVVWNLLSNAVKFTPREGQVQVRLELRREEARIVVSDSGEGIAPDFLPHVFDRFRQADASITRRHGGLGLGLSIVKQIVELHGGSVHVASPGEGQGATFLITLPRSASPAVSTAPLARTPPAACVLTEPASPPPSLKGLHVLVVDDEADGREVMQVLLEGQLARVSTASSAREALKLVRDERPDLLLCDVGMPEMDGCQLLATLRGWPAEQGGLTPAVAVTAFARTEDRVRALKAGFEGYLIKPVEISELISTMARLASALRAQA